jgi:hypothetical protein
MQEVSDFALPPTTGGNEPWKILGRMNTKPLKTAKDAIEADHRKR